MKASKLTKLLIQAKEQARTLGDENLVAILSEAWEIHSNLDNKVTEMTLALEVYNRYR
jgi:predicted double-glycine peptidase